MTTAAQMLDVAARNVGYAEQPAGSNETKFAAIAGHANGYAWCATFQVACARTSELKLPNESAYTPTLAQGFRDAGRWSTDAPRVGDLVFFDFGLGRISHVGLVTVVHGPHDVETIEGNTDEAGGRTGGKVMRKRRQTCIVGYGHPDYTVALETHRTVAKVGPTIDQSTARFHTTAVKVIQADLRVSADGQWGPQTQAAVIAFQRKQQLTPDGIVGPATWRALAAA